MHRNFTSAYVKQIITSRTGVMRPRKLPMLFRFAHIVMHQSSEHNYMPGFVIFFLQFPYVNKMCKLTNHGRHSLRSPGVTRILEV